MSKANQLPVGHPEWFRSRSHRYEFFATIDEMATFFLTELPAAHAPYSWLALSKKRGKDGVKGLKESPLSESRLLFKSNFEIYLRSKEITPDLDAARAPFVRQRPDDYEFQVRFAGLPQFQIGVSGEGSWDWSIVYALRRQPENSLHEFSDYLPLFNQIKRKIRKKLVVWGEYTHPPGGVATWKKPMLTEAFAAAIREGKIKSPMRILRKQG